MAEQLKVCFPKKSLFSHVAYDLNEHMGFRHAGEFIAAPILEAMVVQFRKGVTRYGATITADTPIDGLAEALAEAIDLSVYVKHALVNMPREHVSHRVRENANQLQTQAIDMIYQIEKLRQDIKEDIERQAT